MKLVREKAPSYLVMALDGPRSKLMRREWFPDYKANRGKAPLPEEFGQQFSRCLEVTQALGIPMVSHPRWEADDVIATILRKAKEHPETKDCEFVIVTKDKDLHQLVRNRVTCYDPMDDVVVDKKGVKEKWGVGPEHLHGLFVLAGDSSDNIKGVPGIGPKGAAKLILENGDFETFLERLRLGWFPKLSKKFKGVDIDLLKKLFRLKSDLEITLPISKMEFRGLTYSAALPLFKVLAFKRLVYNAESK